MAINLTGKRVSFPDIHREGGLPVLDRTTLPPSGVMPYVTKERPSWLWKGEPLYWDKEEEDD